MTMREGPGADQHFPLSYGAGQGMYVKYEQPPTNKLSMVIITTTITILIIDSFSRP